MTTCQFKINDLIKPIGTISTSNMCDISNIVLAIVKDSPDNLTKRRSYIKIKIIKGYSKNRLDESHTIWVFANAFELITPKKNYQIF